MLGQLMITTLLVLVFLKMVSTIMAVIVLALGLVKRKAEATCFADQPILLVCRYLLAVVRLHVSLGGGGGFSTPRAVRSHIFRQAACPMQLRSKTGQRFGSDNADTI